jgi:CHASE2 domain-containing sensor protein
VLVGVALAWRSVQAPALLKFALTGSVTCLLCYLLAGALLWVPGVKRVL